jgi:protein gp37
MAQPSAIEWTEFSWNPVTGCTKVSSGCANCYAERMAYRLQAMGVERYKSGFTVRTHPHVLDAPMKWRRPRVIFVNSMSDLFHEDVPSSFIKRIFNIMNQCPQHTFQVLTKRSHRLEEISADVHWTHNIWMGVTVENREVVDRVRHLRECHSRVNFISCEPLLGPIPHLDLKKVDWVIVGGESGPKARPMQREWATSIRDQCVKAGVPYFFKQWGGWNKKAAGRILDGRLWNQMPPLAHEVTRARMKWKHPNNPLIPVNCV